MTYHYEVQGRGEPLLLLHGFTGSSQNWYGIGPVLAEQFQVITLDLPGHGRTDSPPDPAQYEMGQVAETIIEILGSILSRQSATFNFHLLGYSMGGRLALYIALHYPEMVRSLVLESASPGLATPAERDERRQRDNALADRIEREGIAAFVDFWERLALWDSQRQLQPAIRQQLRDLRLQNNSVGLANSLRGMGTAVQPSLWNRLNELRMPVLLITGELDHKFVRIGQEMAQAIPHAQQTIVSGAGHTVHLERPLVYTNLVRDFID